MDAVICEPLRTPVGRFGGALKEVPAADLGTAVVRALLERTGLAGDEVDDLILGHCYPSAEAPAIGRVVALDAGLPIGVPGVQVDRRCGSGLQAVVNAAMQVATGAGRLVIAGGTESMSRVPFYSNEMRWGARQGSVTLHDPLSRGRTTPGGRSYPVEGGMLETAENLRREYAIPREEQDALAMRSHQRAVAAQQSGAFADELVPVTGTVSIRR
jgi:acetyl-CoA C-acetyltransferase